MTPKGTLITSENAEALQVGDFIFLSAVNALDENGLPKGADIREHVLFCLKKLQDVLTEAGGNLDNIVQLRIYCSDDANLTVSQIRMLLSEVMEEPLPALSVIPSGRIEGKVLMDGTAVLLNTPAGCSGCGKYGGSC